jgi:regulator of sigma E protease
MIGKVSPRSPAAEAGLAKGDQVLTIDGIKLYSLAQFSQYLRDQKWQTVRLGIQTAAGGTREVELTPERPLKPAGADPMVGIEWDANSDVDIRIVYPEPLRQVKDSLHMMWITITSVIAPDSNIGVDHLSGPVGIAKMQYQLLQMENGWRRILAFMVLFNVNLAVLNMMPFPVLDGGHITLAILEKIFGRPVQAKPLEILQTLCALLLMRRPEYFSWRQLSEGLLFRMPGGGLTTAVAVFGLTGVGATEMFMYPYWCLEKGYARFAGPSDGSGAWRSRALGWIRGKLTAILLFQNVHCKNRP